jgi:hypothetical protein
MTTNFTTLMSKQKHSFYPLRFMASDFFVPYWRCFIPVELDPAEVRIVQEAARAAVDFSMGDEEVYWLIDFSEDRALATWSLFASRTRALRPETLEHVKVLALQLALSSDETDSADYLLNLITRLRFDEALRRDLAYSDRDANILGAAYESAGDVLVDMGKIKQDWLHSTSDWDLRLKSQTPDLPESVSVIFSMAYSPRTELPLLRVNLRTLLENEQDHRTFLSRLKEAFDRSLSEGIKVKFPALLEI